MYISEFKGGYVWGVDSGKTFASENEAKDAVAHNLPFANGEKLIIEKAA